MTGSAKYLGITLRTKFNITRHIENVYAKSKVAFELYGRIAKTVWGLKYATLMTLYRGFPGNHHVWSWDFGGSY